MRTEIEPAMGLGDVEGVSVVLVGVETDDARVTFHLQGLPSELTRRRDRDYATAFATWRATRLADGRNAAGRRPAQPGEVLAKLPLAVADALGTDYRRRSSTAGGSGTEWSARVSFEPAPPVDLDHVRLRVGDGSTVVDVGLPGDDA